MKLARSQTAASGVAVFIAGVGLDLIGLAGNSSEDGEIVAQSAQTMKAQKGVDHDD